jgi:hypothetical protein
MTTRERTRLEREIELRVRREIKRANDARIAELEMIVGKA